MTPNTLLLRQAHPNFIDRGRITSQVFLPFPKDEGKLSVYDGDQITAADAHAHYTTVLGYQSHSVWAVMKQEADGAGVPAEPDPLPEFPAHAAIDFSRQPPPDWRKIAKRLQACALTRGCQHLPA
jgi:hypothetical protein